MIPLELKKDKKGLLYLEDNNIFSKTCLNIDKRKGVDEFYQSLFYPIQSTEEYIIKYNCTEFTRKQIKRIKEMLAILIEKQKDIKMTDFPIAYYTYMERLSGLIIKYYKDSISCDRIFDLQDIELLGKYYYHDEDNIRNTFMLFDDILNILQELIDNNIYYLDINPGNFVIFDNQVKLIDFDYRLIQFEKSELLLNIIKCRYFNMIRKMLRSVNLYSETNCNNLEESKKYLKKLENNVRKG